MDTTHSSYSTQIKVGFFTLMGLLMVVALTVLVNGRPFWWRSCQLVKINVEDATGLKTKSPIRSLGIEIGYLKSVMLSESHVTLEICVTAPVEVLTSTRAFIRGEGFLGDKFVELKPVKYVGNEGQNTGTEFDKLPKPKSSSDDRSKKEIITFERGFKGIALARFEKLWNRIVPNVQAEVIPEQSAAQAALPVSRKATIDRANARGGREIPVGEESQDIQHLVTRVDELVNQMSGLTDNLRQAINPEELRSTMRQINQTLANASKTLAPEGGLTQTAQRTLAKLEDAIEQLRDMMTRVNKGEGSVGMLINDPTYAEEIRQAIRGVNRLLNKVADVRFNVDLGATQITGYNGTRAWFQLSIWPRPERYYLIGIAFDPRGKISNTTVTTTAGGLTQSTQTVVQDQTAAMFTAMLGRVFYKRYDLSIGALYNDAAASAQFNLGPNGSEDRIFLRNDVYVRNSDSQIDDRISVTGVPFHNVYLRAGLESVRGYSGNGQPVFLFGAGINFDDDDIKLLFALK